MASYVLLSRENGVVHKSSVVVFSMSQIIQFFGSWYVTPMFQ